MEDNNDLYQNNITNSNDSQTPVIGASGVNHHRLIIGVSVTAMALLIVGGFFWYTNRVQKADQFPVIQDTDHDLLSDEDEQSRGTDINNPDTDGDGVEDGIEVRRGMDPNNAMSLKPGVSDKDVVLEEFFSQQDQERQKYLEQQQVQQQ